MKSNSHYGKIPTILIALWCVSGAVSCGSTDSGTDTGDDSVERDTIDPEPSEPCQIDTPCADNSDCPDGFRCNTALEPPSCQRLYCGSIGSPCSESPFCGTKTCQDGICICRQDCSKQECGPDPVCALSCGECTDGGIPGTCRDVGKNQNLPPEFAGYKKICSYTPDCDAEITSSECKNKCGTTARYYYEEWREDVECMCGCEDGFWCNAGTCEQLLESDGMVLVPKGSFTMGCAEDSDTECWYDEYPPHVVNLNGYYIDKTEVTQAAYAECVTAGKCRRPSCEWEPTKKAAEPARCVAWSDADTYCAFRNKRLPTEAEWERAARGDSGRVFPWGNDPATCDLAAMAGPAENCANESPGAVCSRSPAGDSPFGLCDMAGNVWEWVADWYNEFEYELYAAAVLGAKNPTGPENGQYKVIKGGSFNNPETQYMRASGRGYRFDIDNDGDHRTGFRCARSKDRTPPAR